MGEAVAGAGVDVATLVDALSVSYQMRHEGLMLNGKYFCQFCGAEMARRRGFNERHIVHADGCARVRYWHTLYVLGITPFDMKFNTVSNPTLVQGADHG